MTDHQERIEDYLNGELSQADAAILRQWLLEDDANMQLFVRMSHQHGTLRDALSGAGELEQLANDEPSRPASPCDAKQKSLPRRVYCFFARPTPLSMSVAALVIGLLITAMAFVAPPFFRSIAGGGHENSIDPNQLAAEIFDTRDVVWAEGQKKYRRGVFLKPESEIDLQSGMLVLRFQSGAIVAVEGPALFEIRGGLSCRIASGKLTANVPPQAKGFSVDTPTAQVVDLGTEFGVAIDEQGDAVVRVFDGVVKVALRETSATRRLSAGESVLLTSTAIEQVDVPISFVRASQLGPPVSTNVIANARADYRMAESGKTTQHRNRKGLPASKSGHWNYFQSSSADLNSADAKLKLLTFGPAGKTQFVMFHGTDDDAMPAVSDRQIFNEPVDGWPHSSELAIHPGISGEQTFAVVRWTATDDVSQSLRLQGGVRILGNDHATDGIQFRIFAGGELIFDDVIGPADNRGIKFQNNITVKAGQHIDFVIGGNETPWNDQVGFRAVVMEAEDQ